MSRESHAKLTATAAKMVKQYRGQPKVVDPKQEIAEQLTNLALIGLAGFGIRQIPPQHADLLASAVDLAFGEEIGHAPPRTVNVDVVDAEFTEIPRGRK